MTRVNLVPPSELYDQHLVAEYRELPMIAASLRRSLASPKFDKRKLPQEYTLGKGHVSFFYTKGLFLEKRYHALVKEMRRRGMNPDPNRLFPSDVFPDEFFNDWKPTKMDIYLSRQRIRERVAQKPDWYRKTVPGARPS